MAGANVVLDVKMRTIPLGVESSMDFTLVGTVARVEGLPPSDNSIVATVPALEFVKLLEAAIVPVDIAAGAQYEWLSDWNRNTSQTFAGNVATSVLSQFWERVHSDARRTASQCSRTRQRCVGSLMPTRLLALRSDETVFHVAHC